MSHPYPGLNKLIRADLARKALWYYGPAGAGRLGRAFLHDGSMTSVLHRLTEWCLLHRLKPIAWFFYWLNSFLTGAVIGLGAEIGPGFTVIHSHGLIINAAVKIGRDAVVGAGVVIGAKWDGTVADQFPTLGDGVFVGAGAKILGKLTVGDGARIGANAVVTRDVPPGALMVGIPARAVPPRQGGEPPA